MEPVSFTFFSQFDCLRSLTSILHVLAILLSVVVIICFIYVYSSQALHSLLFGLVLV